MRRVGQNKAFADNNKLATSQMRSLFLVNFQGVAL